MKTPRLNDFDPKAQPPKELKSSMDDFPAIEKPKAADLKEVITPSTTVPKVPVVRGVPVVLHVDSGKRKIKKRHPFDIYEDQIEELKKLSLEDRMQGGFGSQSAMVREALDDYINKKRKHK